MNSFVIHANVFDPNCVYPIIYILLINLASIRYEKQIQNFKNILSYFFLNGKANVKCKELRPRHPPCSDGHEPSRQDFFQLDSKLAFQLV